MTDIPLRDRLYLTVNDAALAVGVSRSKIYEWIREKRIRVVRLDGRSKIAVAELLAFCERDGAAA
jgi:excisionase family DNA binding protein